MTFDRIYRTNGWAGDESRSGPGSGTAATRAVASAVVALVAELGVKTVLDYGCGDGFWMPDLPGYRGIDVSPVAIRLAKIAHPGRRFRVDQGGPLPRVDLVLCRDVMQHLPTADALAIVDRVIASGSTFLLASTYVGGANVEVDPGGCYSPDLTAPPFRFPEPLRLIFDGYHYHAHDTAEVRDPTKFLALWALP